MSNQRSKKKKYVSAWIDYRLRQKIEQVMVEQDVSLTRAMEILIDAGFRGLDHKDNQNQDSSK